MMEAKKQQSFVFGGDTGVSYDDLQRKRQVVDALMANTNRMPQNLGEGLHAIGNALMVRGLNKQIEKGEAQGRESAKGLIAAALAGGKPSHTKFGFFDSSQPTPTVPRSEEQEIGDAAMTALGRPEMVGASNFDFGSYAVGGAASRGDSFTGLKPEMQAALMPFLQAADAELGPGALKITSAYRSPELQAQLWDAAVKKYGSPEAARKWVAPPGHSQHNKGSAIDFAGADGGLLRDANSREAQWIKANAAKYGLAVPMDWEPWQVELAGARGQASGQSAQPQQADYSAVYEALASPWLNEGQRAMLMAELQDRKTADARAYDRWEQSNDPMRQMQLQKAKLELEQMQNPQPGYSVLSDEQEAQMGLDPAGSYQQGADGKITRIGGGGTHVNVTTGGGEPDRYLYGSDAGLPQGWRYDRQTQRAEPTPGGPAALEAQAAEEAGEKAKVAKTNSANIVLDEIGIAKDLIAGQSTLSPATGLIGAAGLLAARHGGGALLRKATAGREARVAPEIVEALTSRGLPANLQKAASQAPNKVIEAITRMLMLNATGPQLSPE